MNAQPAREPASQLSRVLTDWPRKSPFPLIESLISLFLFLFRLKDTHLAHCLPTNRSVTFLARFGIALLLRHTNSNQSCSRMNLTVTSDSCVFFFHIIIHIFILLYTSLPPPHFRMDVVTTFYYCYRTQGFQLVPFALKHGFFYRVKLQDKKDILRSDFIHL